MLQILNKMLFAKPDIKKTIENLLKQSLETHQIDPKTSALIEGAMHLMELHVDDIMVPRSQMAVIKINQSIEEILEIVIASAHSRFPVMDCDEKEVLGILLAKDLLKFITQKPEKISIRQVLRQSYFVPSSKRLNHLLNDFQHQRHHLALVNNEHGELCGLITIEDILEQVVGDIVDEHDSDDDPMIFDHGDNKTFTVKASTPVEEFNEALSTDFDCDKYHTISGWIMELFGYMPKKGDKLQYKDLEVIILRSDLRKIYLLKVLKVANDVENSKKDKVL